MQMQSCKEGRMLFRPSGQYTVFPCEGYSKLSSVTLSVIDLPTLV